MKPRPPVPFRVNHHVTGGPICASLTWSIRGILVLIILVSLLFSRGQVLIMASLSALFMATLAFLLWGMSIRTSDNPLRDIIKAVSKKNHFHDQQMLMALLIGGVSALVGTACVQFGLSITWIVAWVIACHTILTGLANQLFIRMVPRPTYDFEDEIPE